MALLEAFTRSAQDHYALLAARLVEAAKPKPTSKTYTSGDQALARISPQPDRLVAVTAARIPLVEAARPLLEFMAKLPAASHPVPPKALQAALADEVAAFQSICQDARFSETKARAASLALCAALDEAISHSAWAMDGEERIGMWGGRLASQFHGARDMGEGFFVLMGKILSERDFHPDLIELFLLLMALGFEGVFRHARGGSKQIGRVLSQLFDAVRAIHHNEVLPNLRSAQRLVTGCPYAELSQDERDNLFS